MHAPPLGVTAQTLLGTTSSGRHGAVPAGQTWHAVGLPGERGIMQQFPAIPGDGTQNPSAWHTAFPPIGSPRSTPQVYASMTPHAFGNEIIPAQQTVGTGDVVVVVALSRGHASTQSS